MSQILGQVDVAGRAEVVARDETHRSVAQALVRDRVPVGASEHERVSARAVVRRSDYLAAGAPVVEHSLDGLRREIGPVGKDDHGRLDVSPERREAAAERRPRPALPLRAADDSRLVGSELIGALDHDDLVHRRFAEPLEHVREKDALLRAPEPRRLACREDDRGDAHRQLSPTVTVFTTTGCDGGPSPTPSASIRRTVSSPSVTSPTIA